MIPPVLLSILELLQNDGKISENITLPFAIARAELLGACKRSSILVISLGKNKTIICANSFEVFKYSNSFFLLISKEVQL